MPNSISTTSSILLLIILTLLIHSIFEQWQLIQKPCRLLRPPIAPGYIPLIGHTYQLYKNSRQFILNARQNLGPIFQINILRRKQVLICDPTLFHEFYKADESIFSFAGAINDLKLNVIFTEGLETPLIGFSKVIRSFMSRNYQEYLRKLVETSEFQIQELLLNINNNQESLQFQDNILKFVLKLHLTTFFNINDPISLNFFTEFIQLKTAINRMVLSSFIWPEPFIILWIKYYIYRLRNRTGIEFLSEIQNYFDDEAFNDSELLRYCVDLSLDYRKADNHIKMTPMEIKNIILLVVYVGGDNSMTAIENVFLDAALHPSYILKLREECSQFIHGSKIVDIKGLLKAPLLDAFILESTGSNMNITLSDRKPSPNSTIGGYFTGYADVVSVCGILACKGTEFQFNPERYLNINNNNNNGITALKNNHVTWGKGQHKCPGKPFAFNSIKAYFSLILMNFDLSLGSDPNSKCYYSASTFTKRKFDVKLCPLKK